MSVKVTVTVYAKAGLLPKLDNALAFFHKRTHVSWLDH